MANKLIISVVIAAAVILIIAYMMWMVDGPTAKFLQENPKWVPANKSGPPLEIQFSGGEMIIFTDGQQMIGTYSESGGVLVFRDSAGKVPPVQFKKLTDSSMQMKLEGDSKPAEVFKLP